MISFADLTRALDTTGVSFKPGEWETPPQGATAWGTLMIGASNPLYGGDEVAEEYLAGTVRMCVRELDSTSFNTVTMCLHRLMEENATFTAKLTSVRYDQNEHVIYYVWQWSGVIQDHFE